MYFLRICGLWAATCIKRAAATCAGGSGFGSRYNNRGTTGRTTLRLCSTVRNRAIIREMATVHMTEAELVNNIADVIRQVRQGSEIVVEQGNRAVAVITPAKPAGRMISEVLADLKARGACAVMDDDFAGDIEEGIRARRQSWKPPSWD